MRVYALLVIAMFCYVITSAQTVRLNEGTVADSAYFLVHAGCKSMTPVMIMLYSPAQQVDIIAQRPKLRLPVAPPQRPPLLDIHGNVSYDFYYQSNIDTPFAERDIRQHTLQTNLTVTVKNQYPLRVAFSVQQGNSSLFRNLTGARLYYNSMDFKNKLLLNVRNWAAGKLKQQLEANQLKLLLDSLQQSLYSLNGQFNDEALLQMEVAAKEYLLRWKRDSVLGKVSRLSVTDSVYLKVLTRRDDYRHQRDSLQALLAGKTKQYQALNTRINSQKSYLLDVLQHSKNNKELIDALDAMNLPDSVLPRGYKTLLAIRTVGIGRTLLDYSELTAKNISITGLQLEFNPSWYLAAAGGTVDYTFRNFIVQERRSPQYLGLIRTGIGMRDGNHIYLTYYAGKKELYGSNAIPQDSNIHIDNRLMGMAVEAQWKIGANTFVTGEVAKSSLPFNSRKVHGQDNISSMLNFSGHSNEAWTVSASTLIPETSTRLSGMYKRMGSDFQSFSLFTTGSRQTAWTLQAEQPFFKQQFILTGALRKNSYATFYEPAVFESNTIFKSIQLTVRVPHWPVITAGFQPTSQLVKLGDGHFTEQIFNTLTGTVVYNYKYNNILMNSMLVYSRFYNQQKDSAFVYFNSRNVTASQTVFLKRFTLSGQFNSSLTQDYNLYSETGDVSFKALSWLEIGGSVQHNYQSRYNLTQYGYGGNMRVRIPYIGEISVRGEKRYMPGSARQLVANNTGRITYTKIF